MGKEKNHISLVVIGHVDAGKSTTTGHLIYKCGGIDKRALEKFEKEAQEMGKGSFKYAWVLDKLKAERERGITIDIALWKFESPKYYFTIIDAPGHRDFIKNMITGTSQADAAVLVIASGTGEFEAGIAKNGQTREHALLAFTLGVKQLIVAVNKMDDKSVAYSQGRFEEIKNEVSGFIKKIGYNPATVPFIPISGWAGDNMIEKSTNMDWWKGTDVKVGKETIHIHTLLDALENMVTIPERPKDSVMRTPISGIYKIKGIGDVLTGRVEQGTVRPGEEVIFLPTHTSSTPCQGKVFTVEMHHKSVESATCGDNCGFNIKGLVKENMPRVGDVMIVKKDETLRRCAAFTAQIRVLEHPGELKAGYCPIAFVRTGRSAVKMTKINWKVGKETGNTKIESPISLKSNEMAECVFEPQQPFVVDIFKNCEGLGRVAIMEGATVVMLGKVVGLDFHSDEKKGAKGAAGKPAAGKGAPAAGKAAPAKKK